MYNFFKKKFFYLSIIIFIFSSLNLSFASQEIKIIKKIDSRIITNIDIINEYNYLIALNNDLKNIKKEEGIKIAEESLSREIIKLNEIEKYQLIEKFDQTAIIEKIVTDFYLKLNISDIQEFEVYLNQFNVSLNGVKNKIKIEILWNQLIGSKFKDQINIDIPKLKKKIKKENLDINNFIEYDLSEIVFQISNQEEYNQKLQKIISSIKSEGFNISANRFSVSNTSQFGGKIGKIKESQLSKLIKDELNKIEIGQFTPPIKVANGFLILLINNKQTITSKVNEEDLLNNMIEYEQNQQFEKFSQIYYNKIKLNTLIDEE